MNVEEINKHNQVYEQAYSLLRGEILLDGKPPLSRPGFFVRRRLNKAIALFNDVLQMNPENWAAMFGIAKAAQRLGDNVRAFDLMLAAHRGNPSVSGFAREAGLIAFQLGRTRKGIELTEAAITIQPDDGSLYSNLGLGHLLGGNTAAAVEAFQRANDLELDHTITPRLLAVAQAVHSGTLPCPKSEAEVLRAAQQIFGRERR